MRICNIISYICGVSIHKLTKKAVNITAYSGIYRKKGMELSETEYRVCDQLARGFQVKEIADKMCRSPYTIDTHIKNVKRKNRLSNIADITREFIRSLDNRDAWFKTVVALLFAALQSFISVSLNVDDFKTFRNTNRVVIISRNSRKNNL